MHNVFSHLEALWSLERVYASTILSDDEKGVIVSDLKDSLPLPLVVTQAKRTWKIVLDKLDAYPSIKQSDEVPIGSSNNRPLNAATQLPKGHHQSQKKPNKEDQAKAR